MSVPIRKQGEWMSKNDERILEYLCNNGRCRPRGIRDGLGRVNDGINLSTTYIDNRLEKLEAAGFVVRDELDYEITQRGMDYLAGEFDASVIR